MVEKILRDSLELNRATYLSEAAQKLSTFMDPVSFLKEYCTIRLFIARQTGLTTSICKIMNKQSWLLVGPSWARQTVARIIESEGLTSPDICSFKSDKLKDKLYRKPEHIVIDGAFFVKKKELDDLYHSIADVGYHPVIFLLG